jgi:hypothetical protein
VVPRVHHRSVVLVMTVVVAPTRVLTKGVAAEEDRGDDEHDPGDDRDPGRDLKDPRGPVNRVFDSGGGSGCSCGRGPNSCGFRCFTHETHDACVNNSQGYALLKCQL